MDMQRKSLDELKPLFSSDEFRRERINPRPGDPYYLHLSDLLLALRQHATEANLDILDYGAGNSPYQSLFPFSRYKRADFSIGEGKGLDFILDESLKVNTFDNQFDIIISTQVLEHVEIPELYLKECMRLLRPGGKLILSTHGIFADHPCPLDLHRWTADGLTELCKKSGFTVICVNKLTSNSRALFFLYDLYGRQTHRRELSVFSAILAILYRLYRFFRPNFHSWIDRFFPESRVTMLPTDKKDDIYINILIIANKK